MFYKTIFNINLEHAYFLDEGKHKFSPLNGEIAMSDDEKNDAIKKYDIKDFLKLIPTRNTKQLIKNHRLMLKPHNRGFRLIASSLEKEVDVTVNNVTTKEKKYELLIALKDKEDDKATFTFAIYATDVMFNNYTDITKITENRLYLMTNKVSTFNITNIFTGDVIIDSNYLLSIEDSKSFIKTIINENISQSETTKQYSLANIIFKIENDDTLSIVQKKTQIDTILTEHIIAQKRKGLIGFIQLTIKGDDINGHHNLFQFIDNEQYVMDETLAFTIKFKNRNTLWRYINSADHEDKLTTTATNPLTKNGFVEITENSFSSSAKEDYQYPNPTANLLKEETGNYISEIFI